MSLLPRPRSCGYTNHIQWLCLRPARTSARARSWTFSCAATKRPRSNRSEADPNPICRSGVGELPVDRPEDEAGRLGGLAAEALALVLLEGEHQVRQHLVEQRRPLEGARGE